MYIVIKNRREIPQNRPQYSEATVGACRIGIFGADLNNSSCGDTWIHGQALLQQICPDSHSHMPQRDLECLKTKNPLRLLQLFDIIQGVQCLFSCQMCSRSDCWISWFLQWLRLRLRGWRLTVPDALGDEQLLKRHWWMDDAISRFAEDAARWDRCKILGVIGIMIVYTMLYSYMKILVDIDQQGGSKNERTGLHPIDFFGFLSTRSWLMSPHEMESIGFGLQWGLTEVIPAKHGDAFTGVTLSWALRWHRCQAWRILT